MSTATIRRQYDEVIAANYDRDPLLITNCALQRAIEQLAQRGGLEVTAGVANVTRENSILDLGMGTGLFFEHLSHVSDAHFEPFGIDLSAKMIEVARKRISRLTAAVDDAANLDRHFTDRVFDVVCTHFLTGFVPFSHLAPRIWNKLRPGGLWSFVGGTSGAYPQLQKKAGAPLMRMIFRGRRLDLTSLLTPIDQQQVQDWFLKYGFEIVALDTFEPELRFKNFQDFMNFAYTGGWLTPFIEELGLHKAKWLLKQALNAAVFPLVDHHKIVIALARKPCETDMIAIDQRKNYPSMQNG